MHVAAVALRQPAESVIADIAARGHHRVFRFPQQALLHQLPLRRAGALVQVVDFDQVGRPACKLLVTQGIDVELAAGDILLLSALGAFEVDDDDLLGVGAADQIDASMHYHAFRELQLDGLL